MDPNRLILSGDWCATWITHFIQMRLQRPCDTLTLWSGREEEMASSIIRHSADERGLVHLMEVFAPDCLKVLDDDGQRLTGHDLSP